MGVKPASNPGEKCANHERDNFISGRINTHGASGDLVIMHCNEAASVRGVYEAGNNINRDGREDERPSEVGVARNSIRTGGATHKFARLEKHANDFAEAE